MIAVLMLLNLRGLKESGTLFAIPTYCFIVGVLGMVGWGLFRILVLGRRHPGPQPLSTRSSATPSTSG